MASNTGSSGHKGSGIKGSTKASKRGNTKRNWSMEALNSPF